MSLEAWALVMLGVTIAVLMLGFPVALTLGAVAMAFGMGLAVLGGGLGQGRAAAAALEGICRNPNAVDKVFTPMLLGLAFVESLVIFMFVTAFLIYGKFGF